MPESRLIEIIPLTCSLTMQDEYSVFFHPESPKGAQLGAAAVAAGSMSEKLPLFTDMTGNIFHPQ